MVGEPRDSIDDTPGQIVLEKPHKLVEMEHVILQPVIDDLCESTYESDRGDWYVKMKQLVWSGFDEFWFCLAMLASDRFILPIKTPYDGVRVEDCRLLLRKIHRWWPTFCRLEDRFAGNMLDPLPGYRWGRVVWGFLRAIGHEEVIFRLQKVDAEEGGELIGRAVAD
jgi:hypothetical protein